MTATIHALFENGRFRPVEPVGLPDRSLVEIEVHSWEEPSGSWPVSEEETGSPSPADETRDSDVGEVAARHDKKENGS
ncbi:MAG: antitoxin family protein [Thermoguttaceae bacterium]|jgi:predicted DNA-binding antitoxin AbrB/MazE fold protein